MGLLIASPKKNLSTKHVFKIFDRLSLTPQNQPSIPPIPQTKKKLLSWLHSQCRNDLTFAATRMAPIVQILLKQMQQIPLARVVRMSGSGSSCFALFDKPVDASKAIPLLLKDPFIKRHVLLTSCRILTLPPTPQTPKSNARSQNL
jgi:4-diphosphocytidyl-2-C-methyl-D-erythritol kinase